MSVPSTDTTSSMAVSTSMNAVEVPSGENCCRFFPVSLFAPSSMVPPPEGTVAVATMGIYPSTAFTCPEPSQL